MVTPLEPFCFWCGGNLNYEFWAHPRPFCEDIRNMCASCLHARGDDIAVFEVIETNPGCGNPALPNGRAFYTGRWVVIDADIAAQIFPAQMLPGVLHARIAGLRYDNYAKAGFDKHPLRKIQ